MSILEWLLPSKASVVNSLMTFACCTKKRLDYKSLIEITKKLFSDLL